MAPTTLSGLDAYRRITDSPDPPLMPYRSLSEHRGHVSIMALTTKYIIFNINIDFIVCVPQMATHSLGDSVLTIFLFPPSNKGLGME